MFNLIAGPCSLYGRLTCKELRMRVRSLCERGHRETRNTKLLFFLDSDHSDQPKNLGVGVGKHTRSPLRHEDWQEPECNGARTSPQAKIMKSASTSTEDIERKLTEDKSTSTDDLEKLDVKSASVRSSVNLSETGTDDNLCDVFHDTNLTDATKVQFLQNQLLSIQSQQNALERRTFSAPTRYWTDPIIVDRFGPTALQRASSSPSLLGEFLRSFSQWTRVQPLSFRIT